MAPKIMICCCCYCYTNGVNVAQSNCTRRKTKCLGCLLEVLTIGVSLTILLYYCSNSQIATVIGTFVFIVYIISLITMVIPFKKYIRRLLNRKRIIFRKKTNLTLKSVLINLEEYIPNGEQLQIIEQHTNTIIDTISQKLSETFGGKQIHYMLTGSTAERYGAPLSSQWIQIKGDINDTHALITDFDFMFQVDGVYASFETSKGDFLIETHEDNVELGYSKLFGQSSQINDIFVLDDGFLTAKSVKNQTYNAIGTTDISDYPGFYYYSCCMKQGIDFMVEINKSGPAIKLKFGNSDSTLNKYKMRAFGSVTTNQFLADMTFSIPCKEWPLSISNWTTRINRKWPSSEDVERIQSLGCHLVPKSEPGDKYEVTWRFSFSQAEVELSKLISPTARKCFLALKIIGKDHLIFYCPQLTSYHLKTIFLTSLEKSCINWVEDNIEVAFKSLLDDLKYAVDNRTCPHYWISQINLFKNISCNGLISLSNALVDIIKDPTPYIKPVQQGSFNIVRWNLPILTNDVIADCYDDVDDPQQPLIVSSTSINRRNTVLDISDYVVIQSQPQSLPSSNVDILDNIVAQRQPLNTNTIQNHRNYGTTNTNSVLNTMHDESKMDFH